jgi:hypothetical protein
VADRSREEELLAKRFVVARHARFFANDLQSDGLLRRPVVREEHLAHAPFSEALTNLVPVVHDRAVPERREPASIPFRHPILSTMQK